MTTETIQKPAAATAPTQPDFEAIKARQQATWASGDYAVVGTTLQIVGETLAEAVDICAGEQVIDVAAGNGNATLAAARRYARVTSTDYVAALLDRGAARARRGRRRHLPRRRCRGLAVRGRELRRRPVDLRHDVHAAAGALRQ